MWQRTSFVFFLALIQSQILPESYIQNILKHISANKQLLYHEKCPFAVLDLHVRYTCSHACTNTQCDLLSISHFGHILSLTKKLSSAEAYMHALQATHQFDG